MRLSFSIRRLPILCLSTAALCLTSCGDKDQPAKSDLALPVTAPMQARDHLLESMRKQKDAARERENQFDATINRDH